MFLRHALGRDARSFDTRSSIDTHNSIDTRNRSLTGIAKRRSRGACKSVRANRFSLRSTVVGAVLAVATVSSGQAAAAGASCAYTEELAAHKLRFVQSQLMVAALRCGGADKKAFQNGYNNFVQKNDAHFKAGAPVLRSYLRRAGLAVLDVYLTELANDMALEAALNPKYCSSVLQAFESEAPVDGKVRAASAKAVGYNEAYLPVQYMPLAAPCASPRAAERAVVAVENNE